ncbi:MAG: hypothetical protein HWN66_02375 [Candidatus Helarchaeota archaeon]|nr:hypothetical protein [Candidatus Helarchaeota archaeon]
MKFIKVPNKVGKKFRVCRFKPRFFLGLVGIILITAGILLFLQNFGINVNLAWKFWPVVLIIIGINLLYR